MKSKSSWHNNTRRGDGSMLTDNQRRKISTTIRFLKADFYELKQLFTIGGDISPQKGRELMELISLAGERTGCLSEKFDLREGSGSASQKAFGLLSALWIDLQEIKAERLRSHGEVSEEVELELDPEVDKIMDLISEMQRTLRRKG